MSRAPQDHIAVSWLCPPAPYKINACRHTSDFCFDTDADCPFDLDAECPSTSPEPAALCFRGCGRVTRSTFDEDGCVLHGYCTGCAIGGQHDPQCDASSPVCCIPAPLLLCQDPSCSLLLYSHRTTVLIAAVLKQIDRAHCCCTQADRSCPLLLYSRTSTVPTTAVPTHIDRAHCCCTHAHRRAHCCCAQAHRSCPLNAVPLDAVVPTKLNAVPLN